MKKFQPEMTVKKKNGLCILLIVFLISVIFCAVSIRNSGMKLISCGLVFLNALLLLYLIQHIQKDSVNMFLNSVKEKVLLVVYITGLTVFFFLTVIHTDALIRTEIILFYLTLLLAGVCFAITSHEKSETGQMFAVIFLALGFLFDLAIPVGEVPDEQAHLETAYQLSDTIMGIHSDSSEKILMRKDDADFKLLRKNVTAEKYEAYLESASLSLKNDNLVSVKSHALTKNDYLYVFPALGITLGRILHMNSFWVFNIGRLCNLILVCILTGLAIKMIPVGKNIIFLVCLTPTSLQQSMSYSYDAPINAFGILLTAYIIRKIHEPEYHPSLIEKILILAGIWTAFMSKGHAYFLLGLLPVIVWLRNRISLSQERRDRLVKYITIGLIVLMVIFCFLLFSHVFEKIIPVNNHNQEFSPGYIAEKPGKLLLVIAGTIRYSGVTYFTTFFGKWLGWFEINIGNLPVLLLCAALVVAVVSEKEKITAKDGRVLCWLVSIGITLCIFGGFLLTITPVDATYIEGVQGRYFILPVILLLTAIAGKSRLHLTVSQTFFAYTVLLCAGIALFKVLAFYV